MKSIISAASLLLLANLTYATITPVNHYDPENPEYVIITESETLNWQPVPNVPGAKYVILEGDSKLQGSAPFTIRQFLPPHTKIMPHYHSSAEHLVVLSGVFCTKPGKVFDTKDGYCLPAGGYMVNPPKLPHMGWTGDEPAVVQINGIGPWDRIFFKEE